MRLISWSCAAVVIALFVWFAASNWVPVTVNVSREAFIQPALPMLVLTALLLGFVPTWLLGLLSRFLLRRKLRKANRRIAALEADLTGGHSQGPEAVEAAILARSQAAGRATGYDDLPPQASPMAVPPVS